MPTVSDTFIGLDIWSDSASKLTLVGLAMQGVF